MANLTVTENWSGKRLSLKEPWTAMREFVVTSDDGSPIDHAAALSLPEIPQRNGPHPSTSFMLCEGSSVKEVRTPDYIVIEAPYVVPTNGTLNAPSDPFKAPLEYEWSRVEVSEPTQFDVAGRAIRNSAGDPFNPGPTRTVSFRRLRILKRVPFWDPFLSESYENTVNDKPITFGGVPIKQEHMRCVEIGPAGSFVQGSQFITLQFIFEVMFSDALGDYPFQWALVDSGANGWWNNGGTRTPGRIVDSDGNPVTDALLDGNGIPLNSQLKIGAGKKTPVSKQPAIDYYDIDVSNLSFTIIYYQRCKLADFTKMGL